jgi:hypothetical protein
MGMCPRHLHACKQPFAEEEVAWVGKVESEGRLKPALPRDVVELERALWWQRPAVRRNVEGVGVEAHLPRVTAEVKSSQVKSGETWHGLPKCDGPSQAKPSQAQPSHAQPNQAQPNQTKPNQTKPSQAKPSQAPSQVKSTDVDPALALLVDHALVESSQAKSSQVKSTDVDPALALLVDHALVEGLGDEAVPRLLQIEGVVAVGILGVESGGTAARVRAARLDVGEAHLPYQGKV